jgi:hypothetical protein
MTELFDLVSLVDDLPAEGLVAGTVGTVVHIHDHPGRAYEVEFSDEHGRTLTVITLHPRQVRSATS